MRLVDSVAASAYAPAKPRVGRAEGLRLALFSGNYNYTRDGANNALNRLVAHLIEAGAQVRVFSPTTDTPAFEPAGELVSVRSAPIPGRAEYRIALPSPRRLFREVADFAPTAVHLSAPDLLGWQAKRIARRLGVPIVNSMHTRFETYLAYYGLGWLRPVVERSLANFYRGCDRVLTPNEPMAQLLREKCPEVEQRIWPRGVDGAQFSPRRRSEEWRRSVGLQPGETAVLFLGRLVQEKGLDVFAETLDRLGGAAGVRPLIVGKGPAGPWLRRRLPNAIFTGYLAGDELGRAVASADILFNPSLTETFGQVTLESMSAGLPVVCPAAPSTRALVRSGREALLAPTGDPADYAEALRTLAADPALRARMGEAARRTSERYSWRASCAGVLDVYCELGAARGGGGGREPARAARAAPARPRPAPRPAWTEAADAVPPPGA
jgi:glycosyltransferase involved in cell wall biosynthesis